MDILEIRLVDHLTRERLDAALVPLSQPLKRSETRAGLLVDCLAMTGYDADGRTGFVTWNKAHRNHLVGVAIVTSNMVWKMVISAMSLASTQQMRAFTDLEEARSWLRLLESRGPRDTKRPPRA